MPARLIAGLLYLQHTFNASDEAVVNTWVENPYWQFFCGETYLQTELPIDPSSLTRWRKRIGEEGVETLLAASIDAAHRGGAVRSSSMQQVIVDTTVMPKAIAHPTDSRLLDKSRKHLVKAAEDNGLQLRQNYNRVAPRLAAQIGRYAHAKQFKRMNKAVRTLRTRVGRVHREVQRQLHMLPETAKAKVQDLLQRTGRILAQRTKDKNKLYALHAPEVECNAQVPRHLLFGSRYVRHHQAQGRHFGVCRRSKHAMHKSMIVSMRVTTPIASACGPASLAAWLS